VVDLFRVLLGIAGPVSPWTSSPISRSAAKANHLAQQAPLGGLLYEAARFIMSSVIGAFSESAWVDNPTLAANADDHCRQPLAT
jgi:hypothetical protein